MVNRTVVSSALKFGFETEEEKNGQPVIETKTISLANPRQDVTGAQVHGVMKDIIAKEVFSYNDEADKLDGIKKAYIRDTVVTELPEA